MRREGMTYYHLATLFMFHFVLFCYTELLNLFHLVLSRDEEGNSRETKSKSTERKWFLRLSLNCK